MSVTETRRLIFGDDAMVGYVEADPVEARDRLVHGVSYYVGLRAAEVGWLRLDDVQWEGEDGFSVLIRRGKWAAEDVRRSVRSPVLAAMLAAYLEHHRHRLAGGVGPWLFPSRKQGVRTQGRLGDRQVQRIFHRRRLRAGIKRRERRRLGHHIFRRSLVTHLLAAGRPIEQVRSWVRHASMGTTAAYDRPLQHSRLGRRLMPRDPLLDPQPPPAEAFRREVLRDLASGG